jgi:predicted patatin/cPLA2 family phospholipase
MATKKKSNYVGNDLLWLEKQYGKLKEWCEDKLDGGIQDRIEVYESTRGNPIIKVIASEETIVKALRDTLKEIPSMLLEINRLKKQVEEDESEDGGVRGNHDIPGFMDDEDEEEVIEKPKKQSTKKTKKSPKTLPASTTKFDTSNYDDDFEKVDDGDFEDP